MFPHNTKLSNWKPMLFTHSASLSLPLPVQGDLKELSSSQKQGTHVQPVTAEQVRKPLSISRTHLTWGSCILRIRQHVSSVNFKVWNILELCLAKNQCFSLFPHCLLLFTHFSEASQMSFFFVSWLTFWPHLHTHHTEFLNLQMQLDKGTSKKSVESTT